MAISAVQRKAKGTNGASVSIGAGDGWATPTTGNLLVVTANSDATVTITGTWTAGPSVIDGNGTYVWYRISDGTESTITCTPSVSDTIAITACEYSGAAASPFDVSNSSTIGGSSGATTTAVSVTTTATGDLIVAAACLHTYSTATAPTGPSWTNSFVNQLTAASGGTTVSDVTTFYAELIAGAGGAYSTAASWTNNAADRQELVIAFKAASTTAPAFPPYWEGRRRLLAGPKPARARMSTPTRAQVNPPFPFNEFRQPRRTRGQLARRGELFMPVPAQVVVPPPPYPPLSVRAKWRTAEIRRGHAAAPVPAQVVVTPPSYPPANVRTRVKGLRLFRPHAATPVPAQVVPPVVYVPRAVRGRLKLPAIRRHDIAQPIVDQAPAPLFARVKERAARIFRGKPAVVVPAQVVIVPPKYPPLPARGKKRMWSLRRRRAGLEGWMVGAAPNPCVTPRPNSGTTGRPGSGITAYNPATTSRPGTGTTARPDTGLTDDPC